MEEERVLTAFKVQQADSEDDDFQVEYEILPAFNETFLDPRKAEITEKIADIDALNEELQNKIDSLNSEIERLTNHADKFDYMVAVGAGVLCGLIDSFFVGEFDVEHFKENKEKVTKKFEDFVTEKGEKVKKDEKIKKEIQKARERAAEKGKTLSKEKEDEIKKRITESIEKKFQDLKATDSENGTKKALEKAMKALQDKFKIPSDNLWSGAGIKVSSETHHIDDFAHHPTIIGLFAAIVSELFRVGIFVNKEGKWSLQIAKFKNKDELKKWFLQIMLPITLSGLLTWLIYILKSKNKEKIDEKIPKPIQKLILFLVEVPAIISVLEIANNWLGHLISDMAGSTTSAHNNGEGMGIPGLFMSLFKYFASIPPFNFTPLPRIVDELYRDERFDLRAEIAVLDQLGKQAIPVIAGALLVRGFYFVRRLAQEYKEHGDWKSVNWHNVIPFKNRTIARMMTIESGTFTAIDLVDAAIRAAIKNAGQVQSPTFWKDFVLRVNFVGVGRFAIAIATDVGMGIKRQRAINDKLKFKAESEMLQTAKVFYMQEGMWIEAADTERAMQELYNTAEKSTVYFIESWNDISESLDNIGNNVAAIEEKNPGLVDDIKDILQWG